ncbi:MAG: O-antigen ligase family protein [Anaerolineae bacterium]|nr:O-antigen ligase family protein [Anaerolineae bacterium]
MIHNITLDQLRVWLASNDPRLALGSALGIALLVGVVVGALIGGLGALPALGLLGALGVATLLLRSDQWGLPLLLILICLLPYAALPLEIGFRPTFIDLALLAVFATSLLRARARERCTFEPSSLGIPILAFLLWNLVTFVAGLAHAALSLTILRRFVEVLLAILLFFVVLYQVHDMGALRRMIVTLITAGGISGALGVLFYVLPEAWTVNILSKLAVFNYPAGPGILRYVEDDPSQPMRAIGTSIDPNALGGLLVIVTAIAVVQLFAARPALPRLWLIPFAGLSALGLLLTFSRGSMVGLVLALTLVGILRYRKILILLAVLAILFLISPPTQVYVTRLWEGLRGEDLATQMRFGEYKDALILISRYPFIGVGFIGAPDIDLYLGVSSLYLLMAEQVGLVGLSLFLLVVVVYFVVTLRALQRAPRDGESEGYILACIAALAGALVSGVFDHFFFNINFIHLVALFWITLGLGVAAAQLVHRTSVD